MLLARLPNGTRIVLSAPINHISGSRTYFLYGSEHCTGIEVTLDNLIRELRLISVAASLN